MRCAVLIKYCFFFVSKKNPLKGLRFRDHRAFSWVLFEAGSQLKVLQYESTEALNLHLKGLNNKEHELFVWPCHDIDQLDFFCLCFSLGSTRT